MFPEVHTTSHRGIPVRWADLPGPLTGTLIFGVGHRDEPAQLMGITHLIEHLAFRMIEPIHVQHDGVVSDESLMFYATGEPGDVAHFLNEICQALGTLGDMSEADLTLEKSVICTESGSCSSTAGLLTYRYGLGGLGNANASHSGGHSLTPAELASWSHTWLTSANAALTFCGPVPDELDVNLPTGDLPPRWSGRPVVTTPRLVESGKAGVAVSLVVERTAAFELGAALSEEAQRRLRHELGLTYSPEVFFTRVDEADVQVDLVLDPNSENVPCVAEEVLALLRRLSTDGFSDSAVTTTRTAWLTELAWPNAVVARHLDEVSIAGLLGVTDSPPELVLARAQSLTAERLTLALVDSLGSLVLAYDENEPLDPDWISTCGLEHDRFDPWDEDLDAPTRRGRRWRGKMRGDASGVRVTVNDGLLTTRSRVGTGSIQLRELVVLGHRTCGCLDLIDSRGRYAQVDPDDWYRGKSLATAILAETQPEVIRAFPSH